MREGFRIQAVAGLGCSPRTARVHEPPRVRTGRTRVRTDSAYGQARVRTGRTRLGGWTPRTQRTRRIHPLMSSTRLLPQGGWGGRGRDWVERHMRRSRVRHLHGCMCTCVVHTQGHIMRVHRHTHRDTYLCICRACLARRTPCRARLSHVSETSPWIQQLTSLAHLAERYLGLINMSRPIRRVYCDVDQSSESSPDSPRFGFRCRTRRVP